MYDWQSMFFKIYGGKNNTHYTVEQLLLHVFEASAKISEGMRKEDNNEIIEYLPLMFAWIISFANRIELNIAQTIWSKYHGVCPYCGKERHCSCVSGEAKPLKLYSNCEAVMPESVSGWQEMFDRIYGQINNLPSLSQIWMHVLEELAELSREFRLKNKEGLKLEFADAMAWFFAYCNRMRINLSEITYEKYPGKCDVCGKAECECPIV